MTTDAANLASPATGAGLADVAAPVAEATPWCAGADVEAGPWRLTYSGYDPATEGIRETLCTLANGYWGTRGAAPHATTTAIHYPGTYLAGVYNRLDSDIGGTILSHESMVNVPNWLPLSLQPASVTRVARPVGSWCMKVRVSRPRRGSSSCR